MQQIFSSLLKTVLAGRRRQTFQADQPEVLQVIVPQAVMLPLPKTMRDEISVPASINGRDLCTGRL